MQLSPGIPLVRPQDIDREAGDARGHGHPDFLLLIFDLPVGAAAVGDAQGTRTQIAPGIPVRTVFASLQEVIAVVVVDVGWVVVDGERERIEIVSEDLAVRSKERVRRGHAERQAGVGRTRVEARPTIERRPPVEAGVAAVSRRHRLPGIGACISRVRRASGIQPRVGAAGAAVETGVGTGIQRADSNALTAARERGG